SYCEDWPAVARRYEAWWAHDVIDRPLVTASVNRDPVRRITRRVDLIDDPERWLAAKLQDLAQVRRVGDALPFIRVEMPILSGMMGSRSEYSPEEDTVWTWPTIRDDWSNMPEWRWRDDDPLLNTMRTLTRMVSEDSVGRYLVGSAGIGMGGDSLMTMRGSSELCIDVIEQPERIMRAIEAYYPLWIGLVREFYNITTAAGAGLMHVTVPVWSNRPYVCIQCDFSFMISTRHLSHIFLPEIARQAATLGRSVFHLDGPGVANHIDAILEVPDIQAIQWVPGVGMESILSWVPMLQKIQRRGRSLQVICPPEEVLPICQALKPEGLMITLGRSLAEPDLLALYEGFCKQYRV
ncbi:MAG TPA: hypothetical protein VLC52_14380, partial [Anaerolineae bacterium]|nr:hypothetical protein [Anaerolineae bacterium]